MKLKFSFASLDALFALKVALPVLALLFGLALQQFGAQITEMELIVTSTRFRGAYYALQAITLGLAALSAYAWLGGAPRLLAWLGRLQVWLQRPPGPWLAARALIIFALAYPLLLFGFYGNFLTQLFPRLVSFVLLLLVGAGLLAVWRGGNWLRHLPLAALYLAAWYCAASFLNLVSTYPFSLEWSEVSRFYQASFYFSEQVYGLRLPLPITHPTRYLLQSVPFLWAESPLWLHRLWQSVLWVALPLLTSYLMARRLPLGKWRWPFVAWSFLYLMQGAVFYHLLPAIFIVLWGFDARRPWRSLAFVAAASVWAGLSRVNWLPVPGALAALLYLLEVAWQAKRPAWRYLQHPVLLGAAGLATAAAAYAVYIANSGVDDASQFGSAFTSDLLWRRLWPSQEFLLGVLPGILLVSLPLFIIIFMRVRQRHTALGPLRGGLIFVILAVLFAGGLVVSVKIGGGTNLHNMDAYMVLLWVLAAYMFAAAYASQKGKPPVLTLPVWLTVLLLSIPVLFAVFGGRPLNLPRDEVADAALQDIQQLVAERTANGEEVLLISQRHLLTFHMVDAPLVHEYEKLFLMEMAISNNQPYLEGFWEDLDDRRFALIITDPLHNYIYTDSQDDLAAENNAWVQHVSVPVLCTYDTLRWYPELGIEVLQPRYPTCEP
ncbi:MAG: hypothetical protein KF701_01930 [Anaerolineales bacterium]|nr:MAG: hypothetical protein KF701_01930 [Anaerolineales bacterium]